MSAEYTAEVFKEAKDPVFDPKIAEYAWQLLVDRREQPREPLTAKEIVELGKIQAPVHQLAAEVGVALPEVHDLLEQFDKAGGSLLSLPEFMGCEQPRYGQVVTDVLTAHYFNLRKLEGTVNMPAKQKLSDKAEEVRQRKLRRQLTEAHLTSAWVRWESAQIAKQRTSIYHALGDLAYSGVNS